MSASNARIGAAREALKQAVREYYEMAIYPTEHAALEAAERIVREAIEKRGRG